MVRPHYRLEAWKIAMSLVKTVYKATRSFPQEEIFGQVDEASALLAGLRRSGARQTT